jgi:hypothetical protein
MSDEPRLTKKEKKAGTPGAAATADDDSGQPGFVGYLVGGVLGLLLLLILWKGFGVGTTTDKPLDELPHVVVMAEFADLGDAAVRSDLARLQTALKTLSDPAPEVLGPLSYPVLLSSQTTGQDPVATELDALTKEEFEAAREFFEVGGWWTPRIFNAALTRACFRAGPTVGKRFSAGARGRLMTILDSFKGSSLKLRAYSHDLRLLEPADRDAINADFGVQTANSRAKLPAGTSCRAEPERLLGLHNKLNTIEHEHIRSSVTVVNFWKYALAVAAASPDFQLTSVSAEHKALLERLQKACRADDMVSQNGEAALVFVSTNAEAKDNAMVAYYISGNVRASQFVLHPYRKR